MKAPTITSKTDRQKLTPRREPYWSRIRNGCYIGYRKFDAGEGTFIARWRNEDGKQHYKSMGHFDGYDAAVKEANGWFDQNELGVKPKITSVADVCREYVKHLKTHKGESSAKDANGRFTRLIYGDKIGLIPLDKLRTTHVRGWLNAQLGDIDDEEIDDLRRAKDNANRNLNSFKAALNFALKSHLVATDTGWKTVVPFTKVGNRREHFLTLDERRRLLAACPKDLSQLVKALLLTAARPGEIAAARLSDFDKKNGTLVLDGKTGRRVVSLSTEAAKFFTESARGKVGNVPLVSRGGGAAWNKDSWKKVFKDAVKAAGLPADVVLYSTRHTAISEMISSSIDVFTVARLAGTSSAMIDKHYGHLAHGRTRDKLDRAQML